MQEANRRQDRWFLVVLAIFAVPLVVAIVTDAALTWDGAFYLFRTLDTGRPFIAHDRLIDAPLHWPVLWVDSITDSFTVLRKTFGLVHVVTPLVSIALSWWVVRKVAPALIIWPIVGIGLATLPGQINFISEGIKAHQLIWPVLLAVLIGLPARTVPIAAMTSLVIMYLHPASVPIFVAVAAAGAVTALLSPNDRERLVPFTSSLLIAAALRFGMIGGGYESGEMNIETIKRQWLGSAVGLPGVALALTALICALLLGSQVMPKSSKTWKLSVTLVSLIGVVLTAWAMDPSQWWAALQFRGPTHIVSLGVAGCAFVDATVRRMHLTRLDSNLSDVRSRTALAIAATFAGVLSIQSIEFQFVIDDMNDSLAASDQHCVALESLTGMPESPLNLWSTPSLSLLYDDWRPEKLVLKRSDCEIALRTGDLAVAAPGSSYDGTRIDLVPLQWELGGNGTCWWDEPVGWHQVELSDQGRRRWSPETGTLRIFVAEPTTISLTGEIVSFTPQNTVTVEVNGVTQAKIRLEGTYHHPISIPPIELDPGENVIRFTSENDAGRAPGDPRDLAFSLLNVEPLLDEDQGCTYQP